ncbi:hypothetical protein H8A95_39280 [Bradyrhizobium sp. Pear76]|uniref:hypothetical protein n=1 Tax=Bradyrhizobium oropedii TaxID=1571201 RepID=UPI001E368AA5|nr:hypothetical protein [Bradyrhizobium oropedii]MCC8968191.1 hypothetical protein [Bradyrhizobium oropedii]
MTELTRRPDPDRQDCWQVWYGDIRAGSIARAVGAPGNAEMWHWHCGFYPGSDPGECTRGSAGSLDEARAAFASEWDAFLKKRTEADFEAWRHHQAWTAEKYRRFDRGERMDPHWKG